MDAPEAYKTKTVEFLSELENLSVEADRPAQIVINERTGTIVIGKEVRIAPVAILHGALDGGDPNQPEYVSQPAPLVVRPNHGHAGRNCHAKEEKARNVVLKQGASVEELVRALTAIGSTPRDIIAILQNLKAAGALEAEVEVI